MNPQVNLLPVRYLERIRERRQLNVAGVVLGIVVVLLAVAALGQSMRLREAGEERDAEQATVAELEARRSQLEPFRDLALRVDDREQALADAMASELSFGGVLADLSTSVPDGTSLTSLSLTSDLAADPEEAITVIGDADAAVGSGSLSGYSVDGFDPGVADSLDDLETTVGLVDLRLPQGLADEIGATPVTMFEATARVNGSAMTGRYLEGLPSEERPELPAPPPSEPPTPPYQVGEEP